MGKIGVGLCSKCVYAITKVVAPGINELTGCKKQPNVSGSKVMHSCPCIPPDHDRMPVVKNEPKTLAHLLARIGSNEHYKLGARINIQEGRHCENCALDPECEEILGATTGGCCFFTAKV